MHRWRIAAALALALVLPACSGAPAGPAAAPAPAPAAPSTPTGVEPDAGAALPAARLPVGQAVVRIDDSLHLIDLATGQSQRSALHAQLTDADLSRYYIVHQRRDLDGRRESLLEERDGDGGAVLRDAVLPGVVWTSAIDPAGRYLYLVAPDSDEEPRFGQLVVWDLAAWQEAGRSPAALPLFGGPLRFTPDGGYLVQLTNERAAANPGRMRLAIYATGRPQDPPRLVDLPWSGGIWLVDALPAPDGRTAYVVAAGHRALVQVDLERAEVVQTVELPPAGAAAAAEQAGVAARVRQAGRRLAGALDRALFPRAAAKRLLWNTAALSPDGRRLYLAEVSTGPSFSPDTQVDGLTAYDTADWSVAGRLAPGTDFTSFLPGSDGTWLASVVLVDRQGGKHEFRIYDAATGEVLQVINHRVFEIVAVR